MRSSYHGVLVTAVWLAIHQVSLGDFISVPDTADSRIGVLFPNYQEGPGGPLSVFNNNSDNEQPSVVYFPGVSGIPTGSTVTQASLTMVANTVSGGNYSQLMYIWRITQPWTEGAVTWNNTGLSSWNTPGGDFADINGTTNGAPGFGFPFAESQANPANQETVTWDVTSLVQLWVNGTPNYGLLVNSNGPNYLNFSSKEYNYDFPVVAPSLTVSYEVVPEPSALIFAVLSILSLHYFVKRR